jgi:hypothetical protein
MIVIDKSNELAVETGKSQCDKHCLRCFRKTAATTTNGYTRKIYLSNCSCLSCQVEAY